MKSILFLSLVFMLQCNPIKVIQSEYYVVQPGIPQVKPYSEIKVYLSIEQEVKINKKINIDNVDIESATIMSTKGVVCNLKNPIPKGSYIIKIPFNKVVDSINKVCLIINDKEVFLNPKKGLNKLHK